jgi:hypothetical protein
MQWPFKAWGAQALLLGHDHVYERLDDRGLPLFVSGLGGAEAYPFKAPLPESRLRWNQRHGALLVTVGPERTSFDFWSTAGEHVDSFALEGACPARAQAAPAAPAR